jgi:hypothetical protein
MTLETMTTLARGALLAVLAAALVITVTAGTPTHLPDVAMSSTVLFHLERIVVLLVTYVGLLVVLSRAWSGQLPSEVGTQGIKYSDLGLTALEREAVRARDERAEMVRRIEAVEMRGYREGRD